MCSPLSTTRAKSVIYLVGEPQLCFDGRRLPTTLEVLKVYFYHHQNLGKTQKDSIIILVRSICEIWNKASIPIADERNIITKLALLLEKYRKLSRNKNLRNTAQLVKENAFEKSISLLFDIAHKNALNLICIEEDKKFLIDQRSARKYYIGGVDKKSITSQLKIEEKELKKEKRLEKEEIRKQKALETVELSSSFSDEEVDHVSDADDNFTIKTLLTPNNDRKRLKIMSRNLASALDRTGTSNRKAAFILAAATQTINTENSAEVILSVSSIRRWRSQFRFENASNIKCEFTPDVTLTIHFDGKLLPAIAGGPAKEERIAIVVSGFNTEKILQIPKIVKGTGEEISNAVFQVINNWNIKNKIVGMSFDTTAANTGRLKGACILLEQKLQQNLLWLACRHHILEVVCSNVFIAVFGRSAGPEVKLFRSFREFWPKINQNKYEACTENHLNEESLPLKAETITFANDMLKNHNSQQLREDYREFLELTFIFLGETPPRGIRFRVPGAFHHARWMSKVLYVLKLYIFRKQFPLDELQSKACLEFSLFAVFIYVKAWIQCPNTCDAPVNDLNLIRTIFKYYPSESDIAKAAQTAISRHLWYLSEELVPLALFSELVHKNTKLLMVDRLKEFIHSDSKPFIRSVRYVGTEDLSNKTVDFFIGPGSNAFFEILDINVNFLNEDIESWSNNTSYNDAKKKVMALKVVNDCAERAIALATTFNQSLTTDEKEKQFLLQVVEDHRKRFPDPKKSIIL